jgi:hypothetical protein
VNLDKVCRKKTKFTSKKTKLEPSYRRMYESPTESEEDSSIGSDFSDDDTDHELSHQELVQATKQYLAKGRTILTQKNHKRVFKTSSRQIYVAPIFD